MNPYRLQAAEPRLAIVRWLTAVDPSTPEQLRSVLIGQLLASIGAVIFGTINGLMINVVALIVDYKICFVVFVGFELFLLIARICVTRQIIRDLASGIPVPVDASVLLSILWCAVQGAAAFMAMTTGDPTLQVLAATMIMGAIGPICARNYPAPRLALIMVLLCDLPFVMGGVYSGRVWLLILLPMTPPAVLGWMQIINRFHNLALTMLKSELESEHRARRDPLTGLQNRLGFREAIEGLSTTGEEHFALLCLDLDGFKAINDTFGHHTGDNLLEAVARRLQASIGPDDLVFRLGGDEFVVLVRYLSTDAVDGIAHQVIQQVSVEAYQFKDLPPIQVGLSVGYACAPDDAVNGDDLYRLADSALYAAKASGRGVHRPFNLRIAS